MQHLVLISGGPN